MKITISVLLRSILFVALIFSVSACASKKKSRNKVKPLTRFYHNMTTHYNRYYNANNLVNESIDMLTKQHKDNYNQVLPLYAYAAVENASGAKASLDEAIKKCAVAIELHRKGKKWQDDAYFLVAKSEFLKKEYEKASKSLYYISRRYDPKLPLSLVDKAEKEAAKKELAKEKAKENKEKETIKREKEREKDKRNKEIKKKKKKRAKAIKKNKRKKKKGKTTSKSSSTKTTSSTKKPSTTTKPLTTPKKEVEEKAEETKQEVTKKEKETKKAPKYFLKHRPIRHEAMVWLVRSYTQEGNYNEAGRVLRMLQSDKKVVKKLRDDIALAEADLYLAQKEYTKAIEPLEKAVSLIRKKKEKARPYYILAQLYSMQGKTELASTAFKNSLKSRPNFDMEFNAELNLAKSSAFAGGQKEAAKSKLKKMLKESKNEEFQDKIYFTLGELELLDKNIPQAIQYFSLSSQKNVNNPTLKADAYVQLAELFYGQENYIKAYHYYDSTSTVMPKTDNRFSLVSNRTESLMDIAKNLEVAVLQDSLLRVADMSPKEQKAIAQKIRKTQREADLAKKAQEANNDLNSNAALTALRDRGALSPATISDGMPTTASNNPATEWWAYNASLRKRGQKEFERKWGNRPLVDNWRRYRKSSDVNAGNEENALSEANSENLTQMELEDILKDVPNTPEQKKIATDKLAEAWFNAGKLLRSNISAYKKSNEYLEKLENKIPNHKNELETFYTLFLNYTDLRNPTQAAFWKNKLNGKDPNSSLAKMANDPNFMLSERAKADKVHEYYQKAYDDYKANAITVAYQQVNASDSLFGTTNPLKPKFELLKAMCIGATEGKEAYIKALKTVVASYKQTEEGKKAEEMLKFVESMGATNANPENDKVVEDNTNKFTYNERDVHYIVLAYKDKDADIEAARNTISNFNTKYYNLDKLKSAPLYLSPNEPLVVIRRFDNAKKATEYFGQAKKSPDFVRPVDDDYSMMLISQENYKVLLNKKNIAEYKTFYLTSYKQ